ncbi:MAG: transcription elongation factor GreB [Bdellovibrionota bacterium]
MSETVYMTKNCYNKLFKELETLTHVVRPKTVDAVALAAGNGDRSENGDYIYGKKMLRQIDSKVRFLSKRLENAKIVEPEKIVASDVRFGATVTLLNENDEEKKYTIVGEDEILVEKGLISYKSPIASALFKKKEGDLVEVHTPKGIVEYEILKIEYIKIPKYDENGNL